jgi:hypothetical protein
MKILGHRFPRRNEMPLARLASLLVAIDSIVHLAGVPRRGSVTLGENDEAPFDLRSMDLKVAVYIYYKTL